MELTVIVPSRGRPGNIRRLIQAFAETCTADTQLHVVVDLDDPELDAYLAIDQPTFMLLSVQGKHRGLGPVLNAAAIVAAEHHRVVGNAGDDHLPRTHGWDSRILEALTGPGVAYGDDLLQGAALPTAAFVTSDLVRCLGWYCPPGLRHLFVDNAWKTLGEATSLHYLPDVVIEHLHPHCGKADSDAGYEEANSADAITADSNAWLAYLLNDWPADLARLRAAGF